MRHVVVALLFCLLFVSLNGASPDALSGDQKVSVWDRYEIRLESEKEYSNPLYNVQGVPCPVYCPVGPAT